MVSLVSVACIASALDAAISYAAGTAGWGIPMCAATALSMVFALYGALLEARALRFSAKARELAEDPITVTAESGIDGRDGSVLMKSRAGLAGWLHRCEEPDAAESAFSTATPWLLMGSFLLALVATGISGSWTYFFRILAATTACAAPCAAFVACPLPIFLLALRAYRRGAAVAGWPGMRDIGRAVGMVVTDSILPRRQRKNTVHTHTLRRVAGARNRRRGQRSHRLRQRAVAPVLGAAAPQRLRDAPRGGLLLPRGRRPHGAHRRRRGALRQRGLHAPDGHHGAAEARRPQRRIRGDKRGAQRDFNIEYSPVPSVGKALVSCLRSRRAPIFAVRDFLVTPLMLHRKYGIPTDGFDFPLYAVRYAVPPAPSPQTRAAPVR